MKVDFRSARIVSIAGMLVCLTGLVACQRTADTGQAEQEGSSEKGYAANTTFTSDAKVAKKYRKQSDLMFNIMAGEIAGHRRKLKDSLKHYQQAMKLSKDSKIAERATRIALYAGDNKAALAACQRWAELKPKDPVPHRFMAILYLREKNADKSLESVRRYFNMLTVPKQTRFRRVAIMYGQEKNRKMAFEVVYKFMQAYANDAIAMYELGVFSRRMRRLGIALDSINKALQLKKNWPHASLERARILILSGKKRQAIGDMRKVLASIPKTHPNYRLLRINYARLLTEAKRYREARRQFEVLLKQKPGDTDILYALALLSLESKNYNHAENYFKRMIKTGNRQDEAHYYLGLIAEERRRYDSSIAWLSKVKHGDRAIDAHMRIATIMSKKGDVEAARRFLYQLKPRTKRLEVRLYLTEADILSRANRKKDALDVINNGLNANPEHADLLYARAMVAEKLNMLELLEKDLKKILKKDPKNAQALNALGYTLADRTSRFQEAYGYIKQAFELKPDQAAIVDSMGWVLYRLGRHADAIKYLRRALKMDKNAEIAAHLGEVLWISGDREGAIKVWEQGKKIDSNNEVLKSTLKRFKQ